MADNYYQKALPNLLRLALAGGDEEKVNFPQKLRRLLISTAPAEFFSEFSQKEQASFLIKLLGDEAGIGAIDALKFVSEEKIADVTKWADEPNNYLLFSNLENYPQRLKQLADAPILVYAKGNLDLLKTPSIAIVGSRSPTLYGEKLAQEYANELSMVGITIVSGLALGIDYYAHSGAINNNTFATIGVLGTGANIIYPKKNIKLARQMAEKALILTEFPLDTAPRPYNFPHRNRIIAGLSMGCLVIEASEKSGALITARLAGEMGIEVFAIPGSVHSVLSKGPHRLIREGAKLVETTRDILEELHSQLIPFLGEVKNINPENKNIEINNTEEIPPNNILSFIPYSPTLLDEIIAKANMGIDELHSQLLNLEMAGIIESLPGGRFQRIK